MARKIKNPEKYIQRLKREIERRDYVNDNLRKEISELRGTVYCHWAENVSTEHNCEGQDLGAFRYHDKVVITGRVVEVKESKGSSFVKIRTISHKKVERF